MSNLWIPSDGMLEDDPIAKAKIANPFDPPGLHAPVGDEDDAANAAEAAIVLAEVYGDQAADGVDGETDDDDEVDDDAEPAAGEI
jgi:hypothetical protein